MNDEYKLNPALLKSFNKLSQTLTENFKEQLNSLDDPSCRLSQSLASVIGSTIEKTLNNPRQRLVEAIDNTVKLPDEYINELSSNFSELWKIAVKTILPAIDQLYEKNQEYIDFLNSSVDMTTSEKLKDEVTQIVTSMPIEEEQKEIIFESKSMMQLKKKEPLTRAEIIALISALAPILVFFLNLFTKQTGDTYIVINGIESSSFYEIQEEHHLDMQQRIDNMLNTINLLCSSLQDDSTPEALDSHEQDADFLLSDVDSSRPDDSDDYIGEEMK